MSSAAATSWTLTPGSLLNFTAVALNRSPYFSTLRGPAFATTHLRAVSPGCQLNRGKFGVAVHCAVSLQFGARPQCRSVNHDGIIRLSITSYLSVVTFAPVVAATVV